jgi:hypothetical protein
MEGMTSPINFRSLCTKMVNLALWDCILEIKVPVKELMNVRNQRPDISFQPAPLGGLLSVFTWCHKGGDYAKRTNHINSVQCRTKNIRDDDPGND